MRALGSGRLRARSRGGDPLIAGRDRDSHIRHRIGELGAELRIVRGEQQRRAVAVGPPRVRHVAKRGERPRVPSERRHHSERAAELLAQDQHRASLAYARAQSLERGGELVRGQGEADQVNPRELDVGAIGDPSVETRSREQVGETDAARAAADDHGLAQRRQTAEPFPLQFDAGPDARRDLLREMLGRMIHAREGQRPPDPHLHLHGADLPAAARALAAEHRDRHHRRGGLEGQPAHAAVRLAQRAAAVARALGEDHDHLAALDEQARGLHRLLVRLAAPYREGAHAVEDPAAKAAGEHLLLGHEVDRAPDAGADHERVEEAAVVGRQQDAAPPRARGRGRCGSCGSRSGSPAEAPSARPSTRTCSRRGDAFARGRRTEDADGPPRGTTEIPTRRVSLVTPFAAGTNRRAPR